MRPITLPRRAPREVYRVYTENDYLEGVDGPLLEPVFPADAQHRLRRVAGAAMLVGAFGAVGGVLALNSPSPSGSTARRRGGSVRAVRGQLVAATRSRARPPAAHMRAAVRSRAVPAAPHRRDLEAAYVAPPGAVQTGETVAATQQDVVRPQVNASAQSPSPPQRSEFGFER